MSKFVKLDETLLASDAWDFLRPVSKVLYIELKRGFTGSNNGNIHLSHRDAAYAIGAHRNTIGPHFKALEDVGLIVKTSAAKLGPSGIGMSATWQLTELPMIKEVERKPKIKRERSNPPKFTPPKSGDDDDSILDDEVAF
jgi:hypothetical protein